MTNINKCKHTPPHSLCAPYSGSISIINLLPPADNKDKTTMEPRLSHHILWGPASVTWHGLLMRPSTDVAELVAHKTKPLSTYLQISRYLDIYSPEAAPGPRVPALRSVGAGLCWCGRQRPGCSGCSLLHLMLISPPPAPAPQPSDQDHHWPPVRGDTVLCATFMMPFRLLLWSEASLSIMKTWVWVDRGVRYDLGSLADFIFIRNYEMKVCLHNTILHIQYHHIYKYMYWQDWTLDI